MRVAFAGAIAGYIVDFACPDKRLIVELDGDCGHIVSPSRSEEEQP